MIEKNPAMCWGYPLEQIQRTGIIAAICIATIMVAVLIRVMFIRGG